MSQFMTINYITQTRSTQKKTIAQYNCYTVTIVLFIIISTTEKYTVEVLQQYYIHHSHSLLCHLSQQYFFIPTSLRHKTSDNRRQTTDGRRRTARAGRTSTSLLTSSCYLFNDVAIDNRSHMYKQVVVVWVCKYRRKCVYLFINIYGFCQYVVPVLVVLFCEIVWCV